MVQLKKKINEGFAIVNVGRTGCGKSHYCKAIIEDIYENDENRDIFIYDVQREWQPYYPYKFELFYDFLMRVKDVENSFILFEEATNFFSTRGNHDIMKHLLVGKRHTNNIIILNFHSIRQIPRDIFDLVNYVNIYKTLDNENLVKAKYDQESFIKRWNQVMDSDNPHKHYLYDIYFPK